MKMQKKIKQKVVSGGLCKEPGSLVKGQRETKNKGEQENLGQGETKRERDRPRKGKK